MGARRWIPDRLGDHDAEAEASGQKPSKRSSTFSTLNTHIKNKPYIDLIESRLTTTPPKQQASWPNLNLNPRPKNGCRHWWAQRSLLPPLLLLLRLRILLLHLKGGRRSRRSASIKVRPCPVHIHVCLYRNTNPLDINPSMHSIPAVDTDTGALLLKSATRGLRWALPPEGLALLARTSQPPPPPTAATAALSLSSPPAPAPAPVITLPTTPDHGRRTIIQRQPEPDSPIPILSPGSLLMDAPAVAAVVGDAWLDRACHRCLRVPSGAGGKMFECVVYMCVCASLCRYLFQYTHTDHADSPYQKPIHTKIKIRCEACRTTHWCSHACFELEVANGGIHALLCPRLRRVRQRGLLKGLKREGAAWAVDGETVRLALQVHFICL